MSNNIISSDSNSQSTNLTGAAHSRNTNVAVNKEQNDNGKIAWIAFSSLLFVAMTAFFGKMSLSTHGYTQIAMMAGGVLSAAVAAIAISDLFQTIVRGAARSDD